MCRELNRKNIGYKGIGMVGFRYEARDREYSFRTGSGKLWKLKMPISMTWNVLEKWIFKMAMEMFSIFVQNDSKDILKGIWLSVVVNMYGYAMFVHFTIYNRKHNSPKIIEFIVENSIFYYFEASK